MELFRLGLFWCLISVHVVGGAALFHRRFPRESAWFGFLIPSLALVAILNAIEHAVPLPELIALLPFTLGVAVWAIVAPGLAWKKIALPTAIFLVAFAFTLTLRALRPNVLRAYSGTYDLTLISSFCMGKTVPPPFSMFPPHTIGQYYTFSHYAASVVTRLFDLDIGTAFNLSAALVSAWTCVGMAAIAWRIGRQRIGLTILAAVLVECASNGCSAYFFWTTPEGDPVITSDLFIGKDNPDLHAGLFQLLEPVYTYSRRELMVPGFWSWNGAYHANCAGLVLILLNVLAMVEVLRRRAANWPWICLIAAALLMPVTCAWGVPIVATLTPVTLACCAWYRLRPESWRFVLAALAVLAAALAPSYHDFLPSHIVPAIGMWPDGHTQVIEFLVYWWPIYLTWFALLFVWRRLAVATRIILVLLPCFYFWVEYENFGQRIDMTGKLWGFIWAVGWSVFFPSLALRRGFGFRVLTFILLVSCFLSLRGWLNWYWISSPQIFDALRMEGDGTLIVRPATNKILQAASTMHGKILLTGLSYGAASDSSAVACFTRNYTYIAGSTHCDVIFCPGTNGEAFRRQDEVSDFYHGKMDNPLQFLRDHHIAAVIVFPDDDLSDDDVAHLQKALAPAWRYEDFHDHDDPHAGIFLPLDAPGNAPN